MGKRIIFSVSFPLTLASCTLGDGEQVCSHRGKEKENQKGGRVPPHIHTFIPRLCINSYHAGLDGNDQQGMKDARQSKRKDKLCSHLLSYVCNLPVPQSQLNCQLQVIKYGSWMRFSTMPSFHTVQLKWRGGYDSLILPLVQPQLSS